MEEEHFYTCPYCGEKISSLLDLSVSGQLFVEDCEVCCRPIEINYTVLESGLENFTAVAADK